MKRRKKINGEKVFSVVITFAIILTLIVGVISVVKNSRQSSDNPENIVDLNETKENNYALNTETIPQVTQPETTAQEIKSTAPEKTSAKTEAETTDENKAVASPTGASAKYSFSEKDTLKWPVKGDILLKYSMDSTIYFKTLGQYKTNPAIIIGAQVGTIVNAAASGVIQSVSSNEETGTTIVMDIGSGYILTYGQLDGVTLKQGATVVTGDKLGTVAEPSKYYRSEGTNLYFKMTKDGNPVDPTLYLEDE